MQQTTLFEMEMSNIAIYIWKQQEQFLDITRLNNKSLLLSESWPSFLNVWSTSAWPKRLTSYKHWIQQTSGWPKFQGISVNFGSYIFN